MRSTSLVHRAALVVALLGFATIVEAAPITYVQSGIASGMIGGSAFTNALVQLTAIGDTANVVALNLAGYGEYFANVPSATTVTIAGIGTATVTGSLDGGLSSRPTAIYSFPTPANPGMGLPVLPYVIIGTLDQPPALDSFTGLGGIGSNALLGYDLTTSIGPITAIPGGVFYNVNAFVRTTAGNLTFTSNLTPTMQGTFSATVVVPEPTSLFLLGSGIVLLVGRSRLSVKR